jgi:hypothetical protein
VNGTGEIWNFANGSFTDVWDVPAGDTGFLGASNALSLDSSGNFYGVWTAGNINGQVWQAVPSGDALNVLAGFTDSGDSGCEPTMNPIMDSAGNLYGTTANASCGFAGYGEGSIYELKKGSGGTYTLQTLYVPCGGTDGNNNWPNCSDGAVPEQITMDSYGNIFGVMEYGGDQTNTSYSPNCAGQQFGGSNTAVNGAGGCGVLFELSPTTGSCPANTTAGPTNSGVTWCETVLHQFEMNTDGAYPEWVMLGSDYNLYGVNTYNTSGNSLFNTVWGYPLTPPTTSYGLTVTEAGTGTGTVTSSPAGINCPGTCSASFNSGTSVTLTETPGGNSTFSAWSGACSGSSGTCSVTVSSATSVTATFSAPQSQTTTFTTSAPASAAYNSTFNVAASASSGLTVAFSASGVCGVADHGNGTATYAMTSGTGTCAVIANQAGNGTYSAAPTVTQNVTATLASNLVTLSNVPASAVYNSHFTVSASGLSTGTVTYSSSGGCTNSSANYTMTSGTTACSVTATQAADSNYASANLSQSVTATLASNTITLSGVPASAEYGSSFTISASGLGTGSLTYTSDGVVCTNSGANYTVIGIGTCTVTASQAADNDFAAGSASQGVGAVAAQSSVGVQTSGSPSVYGSAVTFTATITSDTGAVKGRNGRRGNAKSHDVTGTVTWSANAGCSASTVSGYPGTATCTTSTLAAGSDTITANYSGDANHSTGLGTLSQQVNQATATVVLSNLTQTYTGSSLSPTVTTTPTGLNVTWTGAPDTNAGSYPVTATITDPNYTGSASATFTINKATATVTLVNLIQTYTGSALSPTVTTVPAGLNASLTGAPDTKVGTYPVTATVNDPNYTGSASGSFVIQRKAVAPTVTLTAWNNGVQIKSAAYNTTFTVQTTSSETGSEASSPVITLTTPTICSLAAQTVTMLTGTGSCELTATWAATDEYAAKTATLKVTAEKVKPTVTISVPSSSAAEGSTFAVTTTAPADDAGTLTITVKPATVCTVSGTNVTMKTTKEPGTCDITAKWAASSDYAAASATATTTATAAE